MVCVVSVARVAINAVKEARKGGACTHNWELYKSGIKTWYKCSKCGELK